MLKIPVKTPVKMENMPPTMAPKIENTIDNMGINIKAAIIKARVRIDEEDIIIEF